MWVDPLEHGEQKSPLSQFLSAVLDNHSATALMFGVGPARIAYLIVSIFL